MEKRLDYTKYKITACMKRPICVTVRKSIANMLKLKGFQKGQSSVRIIHTSILKTSLRRELSNLFCNNCEDFLRDTARD